MNIATPKPHDLAVALVLALAPSLASADTGARVFLQQWDPAHPQRQDFHEVYRSPTIVSEELQAAWAEARPRICDNITADLAAPGRAAGETLSDVTCLLGEQADSRVDAGGALGSRFATHLAIDGYIEATTTTPLPLGAAFDPRFSIAVNGDLVLGLSFQDDPVHPLRLDSVHFDLDGVEIDSHDFSGDVAKWAAGRMLPYFEQGAGKEMIEGVINASLEKHRDLFVAALQEMNSLLRAPPGYVRAGVRITPDSVDLAFMPAPVPVPNGGMMNGTIRWDPASYSPADGCDSFDIQALVQTGPAPMFSGEPPPTRRIGALNIHPDGSSACRFQLIGLAQGWPNQLTARVEGAGRSGSNSMGIGWTYEMRADGWPGHEIVPAPVANDRDYAVIRSATGGVLAEDALRRLQRRQPAAIRINPATNSLRKVREAGVARPAAAQGVVAPKVRTKATVQKISN